MLYNLSLSKKSREGSRNFHGPKDQNALDFTCYFCYFVGFVFEENLVKLYPGTLHSIDVPATEISIQLVNRDVPSSHFCDVMFNMYIVTPSYLYDVIKSQEKNPSSRLT